MNPSYLGVLTIGYWGEYIQALKWNIAYDDVAEEGALNRHP